MPSRLSQSATSWRNGKCGAGLWPDHIPVELPAISGSVEPGALDHTGIGAAGIGVSAWDPGRAWIGSDRRDSGGSSRRCCGDNSGIGPSSGGTGSCTLAFRRPYMFKIRPHGPVPQPGYPVTSDGLRTDSVTVDHDGVLQIFGGWGIG